MRQTPRPARIAWRSRGLGFTLIELMLTLAILAIALAISIPQFNTGRALARVEAKTFSAALNHARSEAVNLSRPVVMCSSSTSNAATPACGGGWKDGWIIFIDENADGAPAAAEVVSRQGALGNGITVASAAGTTITFSNAGFTTNNGEFKFCTAADLSAGRRVVLAASGRAMKVAGTVSCP